MSVKTLNTIKQPVFIKQHAFLFVHLIALSFLSGCSTTSEVFECEAGKGIGCKSISEVNKMVDTGKLAHNDEHDFLKAVAPVFEKYTPATETREAGLNEIVLSDQTMVSRVQEAPLRVWIAPFQDEQGNLHEGSVIHPVIRPGYWQLTPVIQGVNHAE